MTDTDARGGRENPAGSAARPRLLVVCVGNRDRGDDGAGPRVADLLRAPPSADLEVREMAGDGADLLLAWAGADQVIVVDAVVSGAPVGTIHVIDGTRQAVPPAPLHSTHGLGVAEAVALGRALGSLPRLLTVYGIEGADFTPGAAPSRAVCSAVAQVAVRIREAAARG
jgi:hydrogenase maturation protease